MVDLCVQADIEKYLNISFSNNPDPTVAVYIDRVSDTIGMVCNQDFDNHSGEVEYHDGFGEGHSRIVLKNMPVSDITEIVEDTTTLTETSHFEWYENGVVVRVANGVEKPSETYWNNKLKSIKVTYDWGYSSVPLDIAHAATVLCCRLLKQQFVFEEGGVATNLSLEGVSLSFQDINTAIVRAREDDEVAQILKARTKPYIHPC